MIRISPKHSQAVPSSLLEKAQTGNLDAVQELLEHVGPILHARIDREIGDVWRASFDADDVLQISYVEAFLSFQSIPTQSVEHFQRWIYRIAKNNLRDAIRLLHRRKRPSPTNRAHSRSNDSYCSLLDQISSGGETPSQFVARGEAIAYLKSLVDRLPEDYANALRHYDLEGLSIDETAKRMKRSHGAIHMMRARAHERLRRWMGSESAFF